MTITRKLMIFEDMEKDNLTMAVNQFFRTTRILSLDKIYFKENQNSITNHTCYIVYETYEELDNNNNNTEENNINTNKKRINNLDKFKKKEKQK